MHGNKINIFYNQFIDSCSNSLCSLSIKNNYSSFFKETDAEIKRLLNHDGLLSDAGSIIYKTFSNCISYLLNDGISYVNIMFHRDSNKDYLSMYVIPKKQLLSFFGLFYFYQNKQFGERKISLIRKQNICKLTFNGVGKEFKLKETVTKLKRIRVETQINKIKKSEEKAEFLLRKTMKNIGWRPINMCSIYTEPSICLEKLKYLQFQKKLTEYVIDSLNKKIMLIGQEYDFSGKIKCDLKEIDYMSIYGQLINGKITCKDVCDIIYKLS